jgi:hypothetical protein
MGSVYMFFDTMTSIAEYVEVRMFNSYRDVKLDGFRLPFRAGPVPMPTLRAVLSTMEKPTKHAEIANDGAAD